MNSIIDSLTARKSVRVFTGEQVPAHITEILLDSAIAAPTAGNQTLYTILNITDPAIKKRLSETCDNQPFIASAPLVLVFLADCRRWMDSYEFAGCEYRKPCESDLLLACADALIAAQNTVVAAQSLGLGSCYIGDIMEQYESVRELLCLDDYVFPAAMLVYGYPDGKQLERAKPRRFDRDYIVLENQYRRLNRREHTEMFEKRGQDFGGFIPEFCARKYMSDFSLEMARSVELYLEHFKGN